MKKKPRGRIEVQGKGVGAVSDQLLVQRARDLAQEDGRTDPTEADFKNALTELSGVSEDPPPEVPPVPVTSIVPDMLCSPWIEQI